MATNHGVSLNIMSESQSSASVTSPVGTTTDVISVASMTLRPLVSDTALSVLVKGMINVLYLIFLQKKKSQSQVCIELTVLLKCYIN